jgi:hypothetical protein
MDILPFMVCLLFSRQNRPELNPGAALSQINFHFAERKY